MSDIQAVQWFPGHMAKTRRKITEDLKLVELVAELVDARIPQSSSNPVLRNIIKSKPKIVLLNKSDMADPVQTNRWISRYREEGTVAIALDSKTGKGMSAFFQAAREVLKEQIAAWEKKGCGGVQSVSWYWVFPTWGSPPSSTGCLQGAAQERRKCVISPG